MTMPTIGDQHAISCSSGNRSHRDIWFVVAHVASDDDGSLLAHAIFLCSCMLLDSVFNYHEQIQGTNENVCGTEQGHDLGSRMQL